MTTFDKREEAYENKFAHDEELRFRATARRNKLLGLWAAAKLGLVGEEATSYARSVVLSDSQERGDSDVVRKVLGDFSAVHLSISEREVRETMSELLSQAALQVRNGV